MTEITLGGKEYRTGRIDAFKQFHVARRLAPAFFALGSALQLEAARKALSSVQEPADGAGAILALAPVAQVMAKMSDEDSEYVLKTCLAVCSRKEGAGYASLYSSNGQLMFEDINMQTMMQLTFAVIKENIGNFFPDQPDAAA